MKKLITAFFFSFVAFYSSKAQVELPPALSQYMFNPMSSNPGYAGFYDMMTISNLFRVQLLNKDDYSATNTLNINTSLPIDRMGAGLNLNYDQVGISRSINLDLALTYKLKFGANNLSVGVQGSLYRLENAYDLLEYGTTEFQQEFVPVNNDPINSPNFGVGIIYSGRKFFGGISIPRLMVTTADLTSKYLVDNEEVTSTRTARYSPYMTASLGTIIHVSDFMEVKPSFMYKKVDGLGSLLDVNTSILFNKVLWAGVSLRNSYQSPDETTISSINLLTSINFMAQYQINEKFKVGFAYELPVNTKTGSALAIRSPFEIMASYNIAAFEEQGVHTFLY